MKVGIVGCGLVGSTAAYAMVMAGIGREIVLIDMDQKRSLTEADDISHAVPFARPLKVTSGSYADLNGSSAVIIAAGVRQKTGESRSQYLKNISAVFREVVPEILTNAPDAVLVVATSPVDVILNDQRAILTVCTPLPESWGGTNVTISLPHLVGGDDILETFPLSLTYDEQDALHASAGIVRNAIKELDALM